MLHEAKQHVKIFNLKYKWVILLNLVHTGNLQFLDIFYNLAAMNMGFCQKLVN